jgi:adenylate cyclase
MRVAIRLPTRLPVHHPAHKFGAAVVIALAATAVAIAVRHAGALRKITDPIENVLYDGLYQLRTPQDMTGSDVVIITVDERSLSDVKAGLFGDTYGWPWPRDTWAQLLPYLQKCGARAVVFDLLFVDPSILNRELDDDLHLAEAITSAKVPVVFACQVGPDGKPTRFAPPVKDPTSILGASDYGGEVTVREYAPFVRGFPTLAVRAASAVGLSTPDSKPAFHLHYYGPHRRPDKRFTFRYLSAGQIVHAAILFKKSGIVAASGDFDPAVFRDKIVLVGATAASTSDVRSSPLSLQFPGVEIQATAIENLLNGQEVRPLGNGMTRSFLTLAAAFLAAVGILLPRQAFVKLAAAVAVTAAVYGSAVLLFRGQTIRWLPLATPLLALLLTTVSAFTWSYLTEGRARQLLFRALSQSLSPEMAAQLLRNPGRLARLGGERREMTVMFTDIAGFTDLSETMEVEKLTELMNFYLEEMSNVVLQDQAYLDKYIGDAIMSFWNGVVDQEEHAACACRAALDMQKRERDIQPQLQRLGAKGLLTRIGINTGPMALGNMGSTRKFAFTVLGDSVNLGSRLEGANKLYGSQILVAQTTADRVRDKFVLRQLDLLRVKGKKRPMAVYELMGDAPGDGNLQPRVALYEEAFRLYQQQRWEDAEGVLGRLLERCPDDAPAKGLLGRVQKLRHDPPGPGWDGVYVAKDK